MSDWMNLLCIEIAECVVALSAHFLMKLLEGLDFS